MELATKLTAAAEADAKLSKDVNASGKIDGSISSQLAGVINLNVKQESKVSQTFWEQDLTYRQSLCFLDEMSRRQDITPDQKAKFIDEITKFTSSRRDYTFQLEKKRAGSPQ